MEKDDKQSEKLKNINKKIAENPDDANLFRERAKLNLENVKLIESKKDITKAIELDPNNPDYYSFRGSIYETYYLLSKQWAHETIKIKPLTKSLISAVEDYKKALELVSDNNKSTEDLEKADSIIVDIVLIYIELNDFEKAYKYFIKSYFYDYDEEITRKILKIADYFEKKGELDKVKNFYMNIEGDTFNSAAGYRLQDKLDEIHEKVILKTKIEERDRIIRNQAHNIKNILRSIINPLKYLQRIIHNPQIEEALKHAEIIREMVNATSLSYSGLKEDFIFDAENNDKGISLKEMIITSVESSVGNILEDIDYYSNFWEQYFPDDNIYNEVLEEYRNLHEIPEKERFKYLIKFINKYMSKLDIKFRDSERFLLGNKKSSGVKMLALFNDLISNAIKYTSFVPKDERFISIQFFSNEELITLNVENSYLKNTQAETTGIGNLIIDNMIGVMEGKVSRNITENNNFIIEIKFSNFWKGAINE